MVKTIQVMELTPRQELLWEFVKQQHSGQVRKYSGLPYHTHLWNVCGIIYPYVGHNATTLEIAMCHDLFEDTSCTPAELELYLRGIGYNEVSAPIIVNGVRDMTDVYTSENYPNLNRKQRKEKEAERLSGIPPRSQSIKYADFIDNITSIAEYDKDFAKVCIEEKIAILDKMREGEIHLLIGCCSALVDAQRKLVHNAMETWPK